ncbi:aspartyl/asparaginyl beta-hydroxylase domain-containing protein [Rahnella aquatilis]|uniref:aspartyl/asparaginyl beta-hydroxylase domain-containing protein n=1 Tax=Rahnella aquatilis TaxID=34038 RepID=UPI0036654EEA
MFTGVKIIPSVITAREVDVLYRYLAISANLGHLKGNKDSKDAHMYFAVPYGEAMLSHFCDFMSSIVGEEVHPSYSFLWNYKKGYALPKHKDRNSVDYIMSIGIHPPEEDNWSIYVNGDAYDMKSGDALILDGKKFEHWREPCPYNNRLQLILCYTRDSNLKFDKREHLGYDPIPEVITSPLQKKINIDDSYIENLGREYV